MKKNIVSLVVAACLGAPGNHGEDPPRRLQVEGRIAGLRAYATGQVFVESDDSRGWQQFQAVAGAKADGSFRVTVAQPGLYWVIATETAIGPQRRGACLVDIHSDGEVAWMRLPRLRVSNKWGGKASAVCANREIPLLTRTQRIQNQYKVRK